MKIIARKLGFINWLKWKFNPSKYSTVIYFDDVFVNTNDIININNQPLKIIWKL